MSEAKERHAALTEIQNLLAGRYTCIVVAKACSDMMGQTIGFMADSQDEAARVIRETAEDVITNVNENWENLRNARVLADAKVRGRA